MSIPISSNFNLNAQLPLDARTVVANITARDLIPSIQRYEGMIVYLVDTEINYQLQGGIANVDWAVFGEGRFGIEDNTSSVNRDIDMGGNEININNSNLITLNTQDISGLNGSQYYADDSQVAIISFNGGYQPSLNLGGSLAILKNSNTNTLEECSTIISPSFIQFRQDKSSIPTFYLNIPSVSSTLNGTKYIPLSVQVNSIETFADTAGKIDLGTIGGGATTTASNGLTKVVNDIQLGGTLVANTTINTGSNYLELTGSSAVNPIFSTIQSGNGIGIKGYSSGSGVTGSFINQGTGIALNGSAPNGTGIVAGNEQEAIAANFYAGSFISHNTIIPVMSLSRGASPGANGIGGSISFKTRTASFFEREMGQLAFSFSDATDASRTSEFSITGVNNAIDSTLFTLKGNGQPQFNKLGLGTFTGTAAYSLQVDSSGNIIEGALGSGGTFGGTDNIASGSRYFDVNQNDFEIGGVNLFGDTQYLKFDSGNGIYMGGGYLGGGATSLNIYQTSSDLRSTDSIHTGVIETNNGFLTLTAFSTTVGDVVTLAIDNGDVKITRPFGVSKSVVTSVNGLICDAQGDIITSISNSFSQAATATTTFTVTIGSTLDNSIYKVVVTPTSALSAALFYVTNKTTTTFDVMYLAGLTGTVTFDWILTL